MDIFASEQNNENEARSTGMCIIHMGDLPIEKIHRPAIFFSYSMKPMIRYWSK